MPHWIKISLELFGGIALVVVLLLVIIGAVIERDAANGSNPFE